VGEVLGLGRCLVQEEIIIEKNWQQYESHLTESLVSLGLVSVAKLGTKAPLLGQGGEAVATGHGRGGSNGRGKAQCVAQNHSDSYHPSGAPQPPSRRAPSLRTTSLLIQGGSFPAIFATESRRGDNGSADYSTLVT
jgi:hypothetical protein